MRFHFPCSVFDASDLELEEDATIDHEITQRVDPDTADLVLMLMDESFRVLESQSFDSLLNSAFLTKTSHTEKPMTEKYKLTEEHRKQLQPWADKWIKNALNTDAMTEQEIADAKDAVIGLYQAANLTPPSKEQIVHVPSPMIGAQVWGIAAGVWWLRDNRKEHEQYFGEELSELDICLARDRAIVTVLERTRVQLTESAKKSLIGATYAVTAEKTRPATVEELVFEPKDRSEELTPVSNWLCELISHWNLSYNAGKDWSGWVAYLSFFRHVAKLDLDFSKWQHYEYLTTVGPRLMHAQFTLLCDRQLAIRQDPENRPHSENRPAIEWRCGHKAYYWHGTEVAADWIEDKASIDPAQVLKTENMERRRAGCEIVGWTKILDLLGARTIDKHENPEMGTLVEVSLPDAGPERFLRVLEKHSGREFAYNVPTEIENVLQAQNWIWSLPEGENYSPEIRA